MMKPKLFIVIHYYFAANIILAQTTTDMPRVILYTQSLIDPDTMEVNVHNYLVKWHREREDSLIYDFYIQTDGYSSYRYSNHCGSSTFQSIPNYFTHIEETDETGRLYHWINVRGSLWSEFYFNHDGTVLSSFICDYAVCNNCRYHFHLNETMSATIYQPLKCIEGIEIDLLNEDADIKKAIRVKYEDYFKGEMWREVNIPLKENYKK